MKPIAKNSSLLLFLFVLAITCTKEEEQPSTKPDYETLEEMKAATRATIEWKKFNKTTETLFTITSTNLKSLSALHTKTLNGDEKDSVFLIYVQSNNQYLELKNRLARENAVFKKDIVNYNPQNEIKYRTFKNAFLSDVFDLNTNIEDVLDEIRAD